MEKIDISSANISLSELVKHVSRDGVSVELSESEVPLARIVPIETVASMIELDRAMRASPSLQEDAVPFADDILSVRREAIELDDPWES